MAAKTVIDATGDADIATLSGCETVLGREKDRLMTPVTLQMHFDHVDADALADYANRHGAGGSFRWLTETQNLIEQGEWPFSYNRLISVQLTEPDVIGFSAYGWDLPDPHRPSDNPDVGRERGVKKSILEIPYRIMVPRPVTNLICPGRAASVEREILGPLRVMAPCMAMGEAAGVAAAQTSTDKNGLHKFGRCSVAARYATPRRHPGTTMTLTNALTIKRGTTYDPEIQRQP